MKLKLDIDALTVESFATAAPAPAVGTVRGMEQTITVCNTWQEPDCSGTTTCVTQAVYCGTNPITEPVTYNACASFPEYVCISRTCFTQNGCCGDGGGGGLSYGCVGGSGNPDCIGGPVNEQ